MSQSSNVGWDTVNYVSRLSYRFHVVCVLCQLLCSSISYTLIKSSLTLTCRYIVITGSNWNVNNLYINILRVVISITFFKMIPSTTIWNLILWSWETANFLNSMFSICLAFNDIVPAQRGRWIEFYHLDSLCTIIFCQHTWTEWLHKPQRATLGAIFFQRE